MSIDSKIYQREYFQRNKERTSARRSLASKRFYKENREARLAYHRVYESTRVPAWKIAFKAAKQRALKKKIEFGLTKEWALVRWTGRCELTGIEFVRSVGKGGGPGIYSCSLDRIDHALGYVESNCRFVLASVNAFRGSGSDDEMLAIAKKLIAQVTS
jgi:hypothetical protein